jgi:predicted O-methyltransferase YrrM
MNLTKALTVEGWMYDCELEWLATHASERKTIAEIGSWMGRSARAMADNTPGELWTIDTWAGAPEHKQLLATKDPDWLYEKFRANVGDLISSQKIKVIRAESVQAAKMLQGMGMKFEMIFIDGAHEYEAVRDDLLAWMPLLAAGGLLCGHDFDGGRAGVVRAVRELVPGYRKASAGSIWFAI